MPTIPIHQLLHPLFSTTLLLPLPLPPPPTTRSNHTFYNRSTISPLPSIRIRLSSTPTPTPTPTPGRNNPSMPEYSSIINARSIQYHMDHANGLSLYPLHRCKTIHLVRHAQGVHNIEGDKNYKAYMKPEFFDAPLTPLGWQQVDTLRTHVHNCGLNKSTELVITSPLLRTMQTAVGVFGGEGYTDRDRMDVLPMMVANAGNSDRAAISSLNCPPILAIELCREHLGVHPCDQRRQIHEYQCLFPAIDFSQIESDEDVLWKADVRETKAEVAERGMKFMNWLWTRSEKEIAVVTHSGFLQHTLSQFGNDCHPQIKVDICKRFANCELRSVVITDRNMTGSNAPITNFPGKIPSGPDLPSDAVDEKKDSDA